MQQPQQNAKKSTTTPNEDFHTLTARAASDTALIADKEEEIAKLETAKQTLAEAKDRQIETQKKLKDLQLSFSPKLPTSVLLSILGQLGKRPGERAACVKREWRSVVETAKALGMYKSKLLSVAVGHYTTAIVTAPTATVEGGVFTCGGGIDEDDSAQGYALGHGGGEDSKELSPRPIAALVRKKVVGVSVGESHTAVWTETGELFTFGWAGHGRLGHGMEEDALVCVDVFVPQLVEALAGKRVIGASAGTGHTAVWTETGELFTFGYGNEGRLGHGESTFALVPSLVEALVGKRVIGASAGGPQTAVWTEAGELFTFGDGGSGQLGHGETQDERVPRLVEALVGEKVVGASSAGPQTAVWTEAGELFTFGNGQSGQLGHGGEEGEFVPRLVEALAGKKTAGASTGTEHIAVWTDAGELFTFGDGSYGQLGHGGQQSEFVPRLVEALAGKRVVGAAAGDCHTAAWTDAGELFTFGRGDDGALGHGREESELVPRLMKL